MRLRIFIFFSVSLFLFSTCKNSSDLDYKISVSGGLNELLVIAPKALMENTYTEDTIRKLFRKPTKGIYEFEPAFKLITAPPSSIKSFLRAHRSILHIVIDEQARNKIFIEKEKWSYTQCYAKVEAQKDSIATKLIIENAVKLFNYYKNGELNRLGGLYKNKPHQNILNLIRDKFGINIYTSVAFRINKPTNNPNDFVWISKEEAKTSQGIFIYSFDYVDKSNFSLSYLVNKRDSLLKKYIAGPADGSYMTTEKDLPLEIVKTSKNNQFSVRISGFWETIGDYMGGPFFAYAFLNKEQSKIIVIDAYVFAPEDSKRNLLTELEAIIHISNFNSKPKGS